MTNEAFFLACASIYAGRQSGDINTPRTRERNMTLAIEDAIELWRRSDAAIKDMSRSGLKLAG